MKNSLLILGLAAISCAGCNAGNAPEPMNEQQLKGAVEKLSPKDQIAYIKSSPMPPAMKAQRIKEIEDKTGYKDTDSGAPKTGG